MRNPFPVALLMTIGLVTPFAGGGSVNRTTQTSGTGPQTIIRLKQELRKPAPPMKQMVARDALSRRQSEAAVMLARIGQADLVWPLLRHSPDPSRRTYLIHDLGRMGADPRRIITRLETEKEISVRRALILSLGEFSSEQLPEALRRRLVVKLLRWYRDDTDPGIHSAIDWLLRHGRQGHASRKLDWGQGDALRAIDGELAGRPPGLRDWYLSKEGHTLATIHGPVEFLMGSPEYEPGRNPDESEHRVRIPRSFAIASREVTVAQFQRFLDANPEIKRRARAAGDKDPTRAGVKMKEFSPDEDCPQILMTWYEAAMYCNWLSKEEGIPESEWCYPANPDEIKDGMSLPKNYLHRKGYRLPTQAEWEVACRAGATTNRFFGTSEEMLKEYGWYSKNAPRRKGDPADPTDPQRTWPGGQLKPNDFGLFDTLGNVWEWGQDLWAEYPSSTLRRAAPDVEGTSLTIKGAGTPRPRRGGSFTYGAEFMRCAHRGTSGGYNPNERRDTVGFRVARTFH